MHFPIAVITKDLPNDEIMTEILAPYDENLEMEPYVCASYEEVKKAMMDALDYFGEDADELREAIEKDDIGTIRYMNLKHEDVCWEYSDINKNGEGMSTRNPKSKWDYWHVYSNEFEFLGIRQFSQLKDIPRIKPTDTEDDIRAKVPDMVSRYHEQLTFDEGFRKGYGSQHYPTVLDYICYRLPDAVVTPEGKWDDYSDGLHKTLDSRRKICIRFYEMLDSFPQDYYLTFVDCHI